MTHDHRTRPRTQRPPSAHGRGGNTRQHRLFVAPPIPGGAFLEIVDHARRTSSRRIRRSMMSIRTMTISHLCTFCVPRSTSTSQYL
jgi:hypothetical protein